MCKYMAQSDTKVCWFASNKYNGNSKLLESWHCLVLLPGIREFMNELVDNADQINLTDSIRNVRFSARHCSMNAKGFYATLV